MPDSKFLVSLGLRIKEVRLSKKMTQSDLASLCDFEKASMSRIESGKTNISMLTLRKICKSLDIEITDLMNF